ncbi:MAG TPA: NAD(P)-binding domain-containing protein [Vicinamibacterales bacterium]|nr:NAD(P)-binding domain-containing protein [Vicinamibacterales bacterium]
MTRIGVIGSGVVGQTLASGLKKHGYDVRIASRTPGKLAEFSAKSGIQAGTPVDVAAWAEGAVLSVKGHAAEQAIRDAGPANLRDKPVIDTTNPIAEAPPEDGVVRFFTSPNDSLTEQLQAAFPAIHFVKAFNSVGSALMVNPSFPGGTRPTMFYCGNDAGAKAIVARIIDQFGWDGADMGTVKAARAIEPLCQLWCILGFRENAWTNHAFHLLKR